MRVSLCLLKMVFLCLHVGAASGDTPAVRDHSKTIPTFQHAAATAASVRLHRHICNMPASPSSAALSSQNRNVQLVSERSLSQPDENGGNNRTLIVTVFGEPLYLEQVTGASVEVKRKELARGEFEAWLRKYRGRRAYEQVWRGVLQRYVQREKITVTKDELAGIADAIDRRLSKVEAKPTIEQTFTPEQRKAVMVAWGRASLMDWQVCRSLYEKHGGRVGIGSLGAWTAFDGQNALIREHHKAGDIKFHHAEIEEAFWQHTKIENFADAYPKGERLKRLLETPPYLRD